MKSLVLPVILLLLPLLQLFAQNESFLGISFGGTLPQGQFAETDFSNSLSGYAKTGFLFSFDGAVFPDDYLGFGINLAYGTNNTEKEKFRDGLLSDIFSRYPALETFKDNIITDFGVWKYLNLHIGPNLTAAAGKFNFDARALAGLSLVWPPKLDIQINDDDGEEVFSRITDPNSTASLGFTVGGGIRYAMKSGYVLRFSTDYSNSKPTIETKENIIESLQTGEEPPVRKQDKPIKNIQFGIGIAYNFSI